MHTKALVVLETMWGGNGKAPGLFRINPYNYSGKRLYSLLGHSDFWVTNACRELVSHANAHGKPDPEWLAQNLQRLTYDLLLLCGKVAQQTYDRCGYVPPCRIERMPHPAARTWTKAELERWRTLLQGDLTCRRE